MTLAVPVGQTSRITTGQQTGLLVPLSARIKVGVVRPLRREFVVGYRMPRERSGSGSARDVLAYLEECLRAEENRLRTVREIVTVSGNEIHLTVVAVSKIVVEEIDLPTARVLGHKTREAAIDAWRTKHPRSPLARLVRFEVGDGRPYFLRRFVSRGGDYMRVFDPGDSIDDLEALGPAEQATISANARTADAGRRASESRKLAEIPIEERIAAIERAGAEMVHQNLRVIRQRLKRAEGRPPIASE